MTRRARKPNWEEEAKQKKVFTPHPKAWSPAAMPLPETERDELRRQYNEDRLRRVAILQRQVAAGRKLDFDRCSRQLAGLEPVDDVPEESLQPAERKRACQNPALALRLKKARERAGLTQTKLSLLAGLSGKTCTYVECIGSAGLPTLEKLARTLGISLHWLLTGEEEVRVAA